MKNVSSYFIKNKIFLKIGLLKANVIPRFIIHLIEDFSLKKSLSSILIQGNLEFFIYFRNKFIFWV